jgi:hypothetical protein
MATRVRVWCLFIGSAICLVIQIAKELALPPGMPADQTWGGIAISWAVSALVLLAHEK